MKNEIKKEGLVKGYLKKYGKNILIVLLVLFSLNKCTVSCNRGTKIKTLENKIENEDSIFNQKNKELISERDSLKHLIDLKDAEIVGKNQVLEQLEKSNSTLSDVAKKQQKIQVIK